ncbi:MAG TPA: thiamine pyrophosphate-binding protein [Candidatus Binatia bacterium]|nr:thiamine pyrophosphate-binding protein [Candidatus Binatia bacterium]
MQGRMPLGDFLVAYLRRLGVTRLFGIPGDLVLRLFSRLGERRGLRIVTFSHEPGVGFAVDGYARATGSIGVACVTYGAGGHNMVNAVAGSYAEHVPVLVISGGPGDEERKFGTLIHHQARAVESQLAIFRELTAAARLIDDPRTAAEEIDEVVRTLWREQRPGYLEIHRDMVDRAIDVPRAILEGAGRRLEGARSNPRKVAEAARDTAERLATARRPIVIAGIETYRFKAEREVEALVRRLGVPVLTTMLSKGAVQMDDPLYMGVYMGSLSPPAIRDRVDAADLVLDLGSPPTDIGGGAHPLPAERVVRAVDRRVDASFHTYTEVELRDFVRALLDEKLPRFGEKVVYCDNLPRPPRGWLDAVTGAGARNGGRASRRAPRRTAAAGTSAAASARAPRSRITVAQVLHVLNRFLEGRRGHVVVADSGDVLFAGLDVRIPGRGAYFAPGFYASMGFSVPAAMGIELGTRRRPIVLCGDGAFQMTGPEIAQAPMNGTRPIVIVMNNGGWGIFRPILKRQSLLEIPPWPYAELARLWGGLGVRVSTAVELWAALRDAARGERFALIEVLIGRRDLSPLSRKYIRFSGRRGARRTPARRAAD